MIWERYQILSGETNLTHPRESCPHEGLRSVPNSEGTGLGQSQPAQAELAVGHCGTEVILCDLRLCVLGGVPLSWQTTALIPQCVLFLLSIAHSSRGFRASHCECQRPRDCSWVPCSHVPGEPTPVLWILFVHSGMRVFRGDSGQLCGLVSLFLPSCVFWGAEPRSSGFKQP